MKKIQKKEQQGPAIMISPAPEGWKISPLFSVIAEGINVPVLEAKVPVSDTVPRLNRASTEVYGGAAFATFDMEEKVSIMITYRDPIKTVKILPQSSGIEPRVEGHRILFELDEPKHLTIEVNDDWHESLHILSNPFERDIPDPQDPKVIFFGPGIHEVTSLEITDDMTVYIAGGAVVRGVIDPNEKLIEVGGKMRKPPTLILRGKNIVLRGRGIIDGGSIIPREERRHAILVQDSNQVLLEGIIIHDSSHWTVPIRRSDNVSVDNIKIFGWRGNSDGIDICNSRNVNVKNCFLRTFDDLVVVKSFAGQGSVFNVHVSNCILWNELAHALSIGAEVREDVNRVLFEDCDVIHDVGRESALRIYHCDAAVISDVRFQNIRIEEARRLVSIWIGKTRWTESEERGHIKKIVFKDITAVSAPAVKINTGFQDGPDWKTYVIGDHASMEIEGYDRNHRVENVLFDRVILDGEKVGSKNLYVNEFTEGVHFC